MNEMLSIAYFSPTGTTRRVLEAIAEGMDDGRIRWIDLTASGSGEGGTIEVGGAVVIGVPVYAGRVPLPAVERLQRLRGSGTPAVIVVVYGNRAFEDALLELKEISIDAGFVPVAAGAFIGEHSFAVKAAPIALGRPDEKDLAAARELGRAAVSRLEAFARSRNMPPVDVPGAVPHRERMPHAGISPVTREDLCTLCGTCEGICPTGAIVLDGRVMTDASACILCHACVKGCPAGARVMEAEPIKAIVARLLANCMERREPETFF